MCSLLKAFIAGGILLVTASNFSGAQSAATRQPAQSRTRSPAKELIDINTATLQQLKALPGFGAAYARRVIAGRPYIAKNQLVTRGIIPADAYSQVAPLIVAHRGAIPK